MVQLLDLLQAFGSHCAADPFFSSAGQLAITVSGAFKVNIDDAAVLSPQADDSVLALDQALERLSQASPRPAKVIELRWFAGLSEEETAEVMQISERSVRRDWQFAKAWLMRELQSRTSAPAVKKTLLATNQRE